MTSAAKVRSRVRTQWLALGAALVVLAGVLVAWAVGHAADRVQVVQVVRDVRAGDLIEADDLALTGVAVDAGAGALVPAASLESLVGRVATIDLQPGVLLQVGMWRDVPALRAGEQSVGAVLAPGRYPSGLTRGDTALGAALVSALDAVVEPTSAEAAASAVPAATDQHAAVVVRVIDAHVADDGSLTVTLAVPTSEAVALARVAATDRLVLLGQPRAGGA